MDEQRERLQQDLRGLLQGEVRCDDVFLQLYASDASINQIRPLAVILPRSTEDVVLTVQYAAEHGISLHPRGAGTGLAGESLGGGIVLDFSRHLRRILEVGEDYVRVQPGVVLDRLNEHLSITGHCFGPDPAMSHVTTLGSVISVDAAGSRWLKYGSARGHVESLQVVLADGSLIEAGREPLISVSDDPLAQRKNGLVSELAAVVRRAMPLLEQHTPRTRVNRAGYQLRDLLRAETFDLHKLICGSEGTLAVITEATLRIEKRPHHRGLVMLLCSGLETAARAALEVLADAPTSCDLIDRRHLTLARERDPRYASLIHPETEALLLVEHDGETASEVRTKLQETVRRLVDRTRLAFGSRLAMEEEQIELFWGLASQTVPALHRLRGSTKAVPVVEDIAVPPEKLPAFLTEAQNILKSHQVTASLFAHAGQGQLHLRPFLDLTKTADIRRMEKLTDELYEAVFACGGTISGEHAVGLTRTAYLPRQYGELYGAFREVKRIMDPHNTLNPGKVVGDEPRLLTLNLRPRSLPAPRTTDPATEPPANLIQLQLRWDREEAAQMATACNGCGSCRSQGPEVRMCPIFRFAPAEEASPRAKANLMRAIFSGELNPEHLVQDDLKAVADLCVNCQMCRLECPAGVDIPKLMIEAKGQYVATNGLVLGHWLMARLDVLGAIGSRLHPLTNWLITNPPARWLLEKTLGIARNRKLPRYARRSFLRRAARRRLTRPTRRSGPKVLYFVDTYANYHDPQLGDALVATLEHNGIAVYVHPNQAPSGMSMISSGALDEARRLARRNVSILAEAIRQGYKIVTTEPAAALALTYEYPLLLDDDDTQLVAEQAHEACDYLWSLHQQGRLQLDFQPINAKLGYHMPCHLKALRVGTPGYNLLRLIPGLVVTHQERGCSGMAGTFGLKKDNFRNSLRAGWGMITGMRHPSLQAATTECSACKIQIEQGTNKPAIHPLKLLAYAYGLMPEVGQLLTSRSEELVVT